MIHRHLLLAAMIVIAAAPVSAQSVTAGIDAWQRADYAAAVAIWRPLAEKGDPDAAFNLGQAYRLGRGVTVNLAAAQGWFERAASKGHVDAETTLGLLMFENGDQAGGLKWLKAAAEQGEPRALLVYGTALFNGDSVAQDPILGYAYVFRAATLGLAQAKDTLVQLDRLLSVEDRKKGAALALVKANPAPPPASRRAQIAAIAKPSTKTQIPVRQTTVRDDGWMIQLGAFSQRASAEALYRKLAGSGALAGMQPIYRSAGPVIRLQVGPFESKQAATAACRTLKTACFPVRAN